MKISKFASRARFGKKREIVAEFMPPASAKSKKIKAMILLDGMPSMPSKKQMMEFFSKKGYWVFHPRYRGSWESDGKFLAKSPHEDVLEVIDQLPNGFRDIWGNVQYKIKPDVVHIFASSFGGPAGILASRDSRVSKVVLLSPVVDWRVDSRTEPMDFLYKLTKEGFGNGYRVGKKEWGKLASGKFYNPMLVANEIDGKKLFIIHAKDDKIVLPKPVFEFSKITGAELLMLPRGGHLQSKIAFTPRIYRRIRKFLSSK